MSSEAGRPGAPWYRHAWPWLLMLPPLASIVAGVTILYFALETSDSLAVEDYAHIEALNRQQFALNRAARELGVRAELAIESDALHGAVVEVTLQALGAHATPEALRLKMQHATRAGFDRSFTLLRTAGNRYRATGAALPGARYDLELEPEDQSWRLATRIVALPASAELTAEPGA
jgi:uncharacterized protein